MKSRSIQVALLSAVMLTAALPTFAAGQPRIRKTEPQDLTGATRAVQQGKGGGWTRNDEVIRANAYRSQTSAQDARAVAANDESGAAHQKWGDSSFRK
jgi:hypothetical protein